MTELKLTLAEQNHFITGILAELKELYATVDKLTERAAKMADELHDLVRELKK